ncbi:hypothetical protein ART_4332 [Arthrobacter sp. PAMC 25486]|nr:hypothetical protein ART_4332 [Arthrobacter sp. PAMC 25486]
MVHRWKFAAALATCVAVVVALTACGGPAPPAGSQPSAGSGDPGQWQLLDPSEVTPEAITLQLGVSRVGCAGGATGEVLKPQVTFEGGRIIIQTDVAPLPEGAYTCQSNDLVPITVELQEPVGNRELLDARCLDSNNWTATT